MFGSSSTVRHQIRVPYQSDGEGGVEGCLWGVVGSSDKGDYGLTPSSDSNNPGSGIRE